MAAPEMSNFKISDEDIAEATRSVLGPKAVVDSFESVLVQEPGVGFLGIHFLITVHARKLPGSPVVDIPMFAKMKPPGEGPATLLKAFSTETGFLRKLQGPLNEALRSSDGKDGPQWAPKCYLTKDDLVIFENMAPLGYKGMSVYNNLPIEYFRLVFKALARYHAAGILLAQTHGKEAATDLCPELNENIVFSDDYHYGGVYVRNSSADALATVLCCMLTPEEKPRLKELQEKLHSLSRGMAQDLEKAKIGPLVPQHGDCHANNFLFKFDDKGNPVDAILIDFQLTRFHVPALDLSLFIHLTGTPEFVEEHWDELFQLYYDNLEKETARCGLQLEKVLTYQDLLAGAERIRIPAMLIACMYTAFVQAPVMDLVKIMMDPFEYKRFMLGCRSGETLRWFLTEPEYRRKIEKMLRKILEL